MTLLKNKVDCNTAGESQPDNSSDLELDEIPPSALSSSTKDNSCLATPMAPQQRKRKRSKGDKSDASTELISKLMKVQEEVANTA